MKLRDKTTATLLIAIFMISAMIVITPALGTKIKEGIPYSTGHYLEGQNLVLGFDPYGYNYQGHMFKGYYCNAYLGRPGSALPPYTGSLDDYPAEYLEAFEAHWTYIYRDIKLAMKWNDAWLSNEDRDEDNVLDRHYGYDSYSGSGAWLTNHMRGEGEVADDWTYFVKIVAAPSDAYKDGGTWYQADDTEIGPEIWSGFAVILSVDSGVGAYDISPSGPGFGKW